MQKYIWYLHIATFLFFLVMNAQFSIISPYAIKILKAEPLIVGFVSSLMFIVAIIFRPFFGFMYDKGYKFEALMLGCFTSFMASLFYYFPDLRMLVIGRIVQGVGVGVFLPASASTVLDMAPEGQVGEALGWRSAMYGISQVVGPSVGTYLADFFGFQTTFWATAMICIIPLMLLYLTKRKVTLPKTSGKQSKSKLSDIANPNFLIATFTTALYTIGYSGISTFMPAFYVSIGFGASAYGLYAATTGASSILTRVLGGKQADKKGARLVASIGCSIILLGYLGLYFYNLPPLAYLTALALGIGMGFWTPGIQLLGFKDIHPETRGLSSSIYYTSADIGYLLGPMMFGYLIENYGYPIMFTAVPPIFFTNLMIILASRLIK